MNESNEAAAVLEAMAASRRRLANRSVSSPIRHIAYAIAVGGWIAAAALPDGYRIASYAVVVVAMIGLVLWDRHRNGTFVNGFRPGKTRGIAVLLVVLILPLYFGSTWLARETNSVWPSLGLGVIGALTAYAASLVWERVYVRDLERGA